MKRKTLLVLGLIVIMNASIGIQYAMSEAQCNGFDWWACGPADDGSNCGKTGDCSPLPGIEGVNADCLDFGGCCLTCDPFPMVFMDSIYCDEEEQN